MDLALDLDPASPNYGDIKIVNGDFVLIDGNDAILQDIITRLRTFLGECFMDNTVGIDYFNQVMVKNPNQAAIDAIFQNVILATPGVDSLSSYSFSPDFVRRTLHLSFRAVTTTGVVSYAGTVTT